METLESYLTYENDFSNIISIFDNLSKQLKIIHDNGMVVSSLSSSTIICDEDNNFSFAYMDRPENLDYGIRNNIVSLAKIMLGTFLSLTTGFRDFSFVDDNWFSSNINEINSAIMNEHYEAEYFSGLFNGSNEYFCDYLERKRQNQNLSGNEKVSQYRKVLKTAASSLYQEQIYEEEAPVDIERKSALVSPSFYLILIGCSLLITACLSIFIKIINK